MSSLTNNARKAVAALEKVEATVKAGLIENLEADLNVLKAAIEDLTTTDIESCPAELIKDIQKRIQTIKEVQTSMKMILMRSAAKADQLTYEP